MTSSSSHPAGSDDAEGGHLAADRTGMLEALHLAQKDVNLLSSLRSPPDTPLPAVTPTAALGAPLVGGLTPSDAS